MDELTSLAKRLADYVRMTIETGKLKSDSPVGIAYRDFMKEWDKCHPSRKPHKNYELEQRWPYVRGGPTPM